MAKLTEPPAVVQEAIVAILLSVANVLNAESMAIVQSTALVLNGVVSILVPNWPIRHVPLTPSVIRKITWLPAAVRKICHTAIHWLIVNVHLNKMNLNAISMSIVPLALLVFEASASIHALNYAPVRPLLVAPF